MKYQEYRKIVCADEQIPHFQKASKTLPSDPLIYQYRNFDSFWKILKSDSFWATNARFCNDEEEQNFGVALIRAICDDENVKLSKRDRDEIEAAGLDENYIVCFCEEDDKLSQWRGYAPDGGASMGFDFEMPRPFLILKADDKGAGSSADGETQYVALDAVKYIRPKEKTGEREEDDKAYHESCRREIQMVRTTEVEDKVGTYRLEIQKKAPYIKHAGFREEEERRLVFRNTDGKLDACIQYRETNNAAMRYPYIVVKSALPEKRMRKCAVRVCIEEDREAELVETLRALLAGKHAKVNGCHCSDTASADMGEPFCEGCVMRRFASALAAKPCRFRYPPSDVSYEFALRKADSCVIVSQGKNQEEVFERVHKGVREFREKTGYKPEIPVWCEGHLPIRKITVGPCPNQKNMLEAIRHYCKHTYWLRDVKVGKSKIPFRKAL